MAEELNNTEGSSEPSNAKSELKHIYYEIESDLLAKPNALVDIVLTKKLPTVVFCNQPSEADLVEVVLKKRNVECAKLIGHVPTSRVAQTAQQVSNGELQVMIVTDISARELNVGLFSLLINYAIHEDPEIYLHRCEVSADESKLDTVVSLVSPLDHSNFHYLKKVIDFEINQEELPKGEDIQSAQFELLLKEIEKCEYPEDQRLDFMYEAICNSDRKDEVLKFLLYNYTHVLPEYKVKSGGRYENREDRDGGNRRNYDKNYNDRDQRRQRNDDGPKQELIRFYLGLGSENDFDKDKVVGLLNSAANLPEEQIANYIERNCYSFIDVLKENSEGLEDILDGYSLDSGDNLVFKKATSIFRPLKEESGETPKEESQSEEEAGEGV